MPRLYHLAWFFYLLLAASAVVWIGMRRGHHRRRDVLRSVALAGSTSLWGVAAGLSLVALWWLVGRRLPLARGASRSCSASVLGLARRHQAIGLALLSGFAEELFFRGAVQDAWGFWLATALFAALHTGRERGLLVWTAFALVAGLLFGGLVLWRGNLLRADGRARRWSTRSTCGRTSRSRLRDDRRRRRRCEPTRGRLSAELASHLEGDCRTSAHALEPVERERRFLDELQEYLRIPSISTDPAYKNDVARCAEFVRGELRGGRPHGAS